MRIFTRYILREVSSYALLGGVLFTFVLFMRDMQKILDLLVRDSASIADVLRIFADMLPNTLIVTIPTAVLAGVLLGLSRLAADSEVTAMRASGIGATTFVGIVSILSLAALGLGLVNTLYFAPRGAADLLRLEDRLKSSQASFEVQPRVFYEDFKNYVLYVQDVHPGSGSAVWQHVFLADLTQPANPDVTTAERAIISRRASSDPQDLRLLLLNGGQHHPNPTDPNQYDFYTFGESNVPLQLISQDETHISRSSTHLLALTLPELSSRIRGIPIPGEPMPTAGDRLAARIELQSRFSYPFACLVLMLIGVPLGLSSKRGGKSGGVVLTLLLVFAYYLVFNLGVAFAKSGKLSPFLGVWSANIVFTLFGLLLLQQLAGGGILLDLFAWLGLNVDKAFSRVAPRRLIRLFTSESAEPETGEPGSEQDSERAANDAAPPRLRRFFRTSFPLLLDEYVVRSYLTNFALWLGAFVVLYVVFTFFELMGDIIRNQTPFIVVGEYLWYLIPYIVSAVVPLCSLLAVLLAFGSLNRSSELTAMKATGISLYRVVTPVLVLAAVLSAGLFAFNEYYLPDANRHQEQLRAEIKGRPAQTFALAGRKWISGQAGPAGSPTRIFYYQAYDPKLHVFANLTVFEFDPVNFTLERRIHADTVHWDATSATWIFENGWQRSFAGAALGAYQPFTVATFSEVREQPGYFIHEDTPADEMSYAELSHYIAGLSESGLIDTTTLRVELQNKLAVPFITLVMAVLAVPFAVMIGKHAGLVGVGTAIGLAIAYWALTGLFSSMGNISTLPPPLAAWSPDILFAITGCYLLLRTPT
ncbi:MAG TPA: LptF/LptG family permease [Acidobacteriaceae bacterium]|nr:LptF/LptG family permease [Acidobacteriaceae bacterium]